MTENASTIAGPAAQMLRILGLGSVEQVLHKAWAGPVWEPGQATPEKQRAVVAQWAGGSLRQAGWGP